MLRSELIAQLADEAEGLSPREVEAIVDIVFESIADHLVEGGRVELRGFGTFTTRERGERVGRNPRTGAAVEVCAKRLPHFKPGKDMREKLLHPVA